MLEKALPLYAKKDDLQRLMAYNPTDMHNILLRIGFKVQSAPDDATIYINEIGTTIIVEDKDQRVASEMLKQFNKHPQTGLVTPAEASELLRQQLLLKTKQGLWVRH